MNAGTGTAAWVDIIAGSDVYDLGQPLQTGMTCSPNHPGFRMSLQRRHGDSERADGTSSASELIVTGGHVGTHIDAFAHFSDNGELHGGISAAHAQQSGKFASLGAETIPPLIRRGILLDVAAAAGHDVLPAGFGIDATLLAAAADRGDVKVLPGDVVLVRTGWSQHFHDGQKYLGLREGAPGITLSAGQWLADQRVMAVGGDTTSVEHIPPKQGHSALPVHRLFLVERGIYLIEMLDLEQLAADQVYEFLFIAAPLKIVGGTGSPLRPLALRLP